MRAILLPSTLLVTGLVVVSCTPHRMYRPVSLEQHPSYSLAFIELDDQGELWAPSQLDRALDHLERLNRSPSGVALVLFVHGWNTDASAREEKADDGALYQYRAMLARLHAGIREELPDLDVPVMGIYFAWRGRVSSVPLVKQLSFYNRRGAAERIAGAPATEAIYRILMELRTNPDSRSVLIGHSFGSMILERALDQAVVSALLAGPGEELIFPADLVVLLNPAGSATQTKQLIDILARNRLKTYRHDGQGNRFERPLLVSFSAEDDRATRSFFPFGMRMKAMNKRFRDYGPEYCSPIVNQRRLYTHTAGNLPELHSHEVVVGPECDESDGRHDPGRMIPTYLHYDEQYDALTRQVTFSFDGENARFTIQRKPRALNDTPYWIMQVPGELIPNHSTILTEDVFRLIEAVLVLSAAYDADVTTLVEREDGVRPVAVVPRADGTALFLDRSRAVYAVRTDSPRPVFVSCLSETIDPSDAIGLEIEGRLAYSVLTTRQGDRCRTEVYGFEVDAAGYAEREHTRLLGSECYSSASVDPLRRRAYLAVATEGGAEIRVADLGEATPRPRLLIDLPGSRAPTDLHLDSSSARLFAADVEDGAVWEADLEDDEPEMRRVAGAFGWPMALAYSGADRRLYVIDAETRTLWAVDCTDRCRDPTPFLRSDALAHSTTLVAGPDGTLWLGDLDSQTLSTILPDGTIANTVGSLSGRASPSTLPATHGRGNEGRSP